MTPDSRSRGATGPRFALASPHRLATRAGAEAFSEGGTAVDAALAAAAVLTVVYPHMCSVGGDLFALVSGPGGGVAAVNASGAAPRAIDPGDLGTRMPATGPFTITVPGAVAGWATLAGLGGRLGLARALAPAVILAREGVPVAPSLARAIGALAPSLRGDGGMRSVFLPGGGPLGEGEALRQPALARTLEAIATLGPGTLYGGDVGERLVAGLNRVGCPLGLEDLAAHETEVTQPVVGRFRDHDVLTAPPTSQGFVLLQILGAVELAGAGPDPVGPAVGTLAGLFRETAVDRDRWLADPRQAPLPLEELLGAPHLRELLDRPRIGGAGSGVPPERSAGPPGDTVAVVAADAEGHTVSLIQSVFHAFGSGILEPETGIVCHNRGALFALDPSSPNRLRGGARPAHTLTPVLVRGALRGAVGTMGGRAQPQILAQVLLRLLAMDAGPAEAAAAPRWVLAEAGSPAEVALVERSAEPVRHRLEAATWPVEVMPDLDERVGHVQALVAGSTGFEAGSDPRADGAAAAG